jgi:hypothetical protein
MRRELAKRADSTSALSISLEFGADEENCKAEAFHVNEHGMYFQSRWCFTPFTEIEVTFAMTDADGEECRYKASGIVAACDPVFCRCFCTALHFVEPLEELDVPAASLRKDVAAESV